MPNPIPNTTFRPIQQEETNGTNPFSEFLVQGLGEDLNYLNAQATAIQNAINSYFANGPISVVAISLTTGSPSQVAPGGNLWWAAFLTPESGGAALKEWRAVVPGGVSTHFPDLSHNNNNGGFSAFISGNTLTGVGITSTMIGFGIYST